MRVASLWLEIWIGPRKRKPSGINDRPRSKRLASQKEGRGKIEAKTDFIRQRGVGVPTPARGKKLDVIIVECLRNGVEAGVDVRAIKITPIVGPRSAQSISGV